VLQKARSISICIIYIRMYKIRSVNSALVGLRIFVYTDLHFNITVPTSITVINSNIINVKDGCHQSHLEHFV